MPTHTNEIYHICHVISFIRPHIFFPFIFWEGEVGLGKRLEDVVEKACKKVSYLHSEKLNIFGNFLEQTLGHKSKCITPAAHRVKIGSRFRAEITNKAHLS